jgi:hypothetical protein
LRPKKEPPPEADEPLAQKKACGIPACLQRRLKRSGQGNAHDASNAHAVENGSLWPPAHSCRFLNAASPCLRSPPSIPLAAALKEQRRCIVKQNTRILFRYSTSVPKIADRSRFMNSWRNLRLLFVCKEPARIWNPPLA